MTMLQTKYSISDANYADNIRTNPQHYNSMRAKPIYPVGLIENNITSSRPFPNNWATTINSEQPKLLRDATQFRKRCIFKYDDNQTISSIHLRSLDFLTNQHLLNENIQFPHEDQVYQVLGAKRLVDQNANRNFLPELSPGDKTYKAPEYSKEFYYKKNANWRNQKWEPRNKSDIQENSEPRNLMDFLNLDSSVPNFSNKYDFGYEINYNLEKQDEIDNVKLLDNWKGTTPLELPFKVLDLDKSIRYRPRK